MARLSKFSKMRFHLCFIGLVFLVLSMGASVAFAQDDDHQRPHPIVQFFQMHRRDRPQQNEQVPPPSGENAHRECQRQFKECRTQLEEQQRRYHDVYREHLHLVNLYEEGSRKNMEELKELRATLGAHDIAEDVATVVQMQNDLMAQSQRMQAQLLDLPTTSAEPCHCNTSETVPLLLEQSIRELYASHARKMESLLNTTWLEQRIESSLENRSCVSSQPETPMEQDEDRIHALEHEKSALLGEHMLLQSLYEKMEMKYEGILRNYNDTLQEYLERNLEEAVKNYSGVLIRELQVTIRATEANCSASLLELQHQMDEQQENLTLAYQKLEGEFSNYQETAAEKLQLVLGLNEDLTASHQDAVHQMISEHELQLQRTQELLQKECTQSTNELSETHMEQVQQLTERLQNRSDQLEVTKRQLLQVTRELEYFSAQHQDSVQRAAYWEHAFAQRSYFNITHLSQDLQQYLTERFLDARQQVQQTLIEPTVQRTRDLFEQHVTPVVHQSNTLYEEKILPHIQESRKFYLLHIHPRLLEIQEISYPYYVVYLEPHLMTLRRHRIEFQQCTIMWVHNSLDDIVLQYAQYCPEVVASLKSKQLPPAVLHHVESSCLHARESVLACLQVLSILFLLIFRRTMFRAHWYLLCFILRMLWFMNPIRVLFFRRRK
jgi:hypothetical protein